MSTATTSTLTSVYGPVTSWRYGQSLGIDPIGEISTCSFNCVYCQLGEIERQTRDRAIYIPTATILTELATYTPWEVDIITLSGSGEPTLALNLGEILQGVHQMTGKPTLVLTNGTLLSDATVRSELKLADQISVKLDGITEEQVRRVDRPVPGFNWQETWESLQQFRQEYSGILGIQTMILTPWNPQMKATYLKMMQNLQPDEIQLNTPTRPKPLQRQLDGRGNHSPREARPYAVQQLKCVEGRVLEEFAGEIETETGVPVRYRVIDQH